MCGNKHTYIYIHIYIYIYRSLGGLRKREMLCKRCVYAWARGRWIAVWGGLPDHLDPLFCHTPPPSFLSPSPVCFSVCFCVVLIFSYVCYVFLMFFYCVFPCFSFVLFLCVSCVFLWISVFVLCVLIFFCVLLCCSCVFLVKCFGTFIIVLFSLLLIVYPALSTMCYYPLLLHACDFFLTLH